MTELFTLITIGIALSMDTFSLSLGIGMFQKSIKYDLILSATVGFFHFFMPLIGLKIGIEIFYHLKINFNLIIGIVLILIALSMTKDFIKVKKEINQIKFTLLGVILFSLSVSFDSLTTGMGLLAITENIFLASTIFSLISFIFTFLGLIIAKYAQKKLGTYSTLFGIVLLFAVGITYLCK